MITAETVNRILEFHGNGLPVVSLYGSIDPGASPREVHTRMMSLLDQVRRLAKDQTLEHQSRLSVRADIERIKEAVDSNRWPPGAVAIFSCSGQHFWFADRRKSPFAIRNACLGFRETNFFIFSASFSVA